MILPKLAQIQDRAGKAKAAKDDPDEKQRLAEQKAKHALARFERTCRQLMLSAASEGKEYVTIRLATFDSEAVGVVVDELENDGYTISRTELSLTINWAE